MTSQPIARDSYRARSISCIASMSMSSVISPFTAPSPYVMR